MPTQGQKGQQNNIKANLGTKRPTERHNYMPTQGQKGQQIDIKANSEKRPTEQHKSKLRDKKTNRRT